MSLIRAIVSLTARKYSPDPTHSTLYINGRVSFSKKQSYMPAGGGGGGHGPLVHKVNPCLEKNIF